MRNKRNEGPSMEEWLWWSVAEWDVEADRKAYAEAIERDARRLSALPTNDEDKAIDCHNGDSPCTADSA